MLAHNSQKASFFLFFFLFVCLFFFFFLFFFEKKMATLTGIGYIIHWYDQFTVLMIYNTTISAWLDGRHDVTSTNGNQYRPSATTDVSFYRSILHRVNNPVYYQNVEWERNNYQ